MDYTALYPRRQNSSSISLLWELQNSNNEVMNAPELLINTATYLGMEFI
jgi:hypothetical protein